MLAQKQIVTVLLVLTAGITSGCRSAGGGDDAANGGAINVKGCTLGMADGGAPPCAPDATDPPSGGATEPTSTSADTNGGSTAVGVGDTAGATTGGDEAVGGSTTGGASTGTTVASNAPVPGAVNIDLSTEFQNISGFGGINMPGWIHDLTADEAEKAFGTGVEQIGMSILKVRIPFEESYFSRELATAQIAVSHGAKVMATVWTPPISMKTNGSPIGGRLSTSSYGAFADYLLKFRDYMESNGVPIYAISLQNEPDVSVNYESCFWNSSEFTSWLIEHGAKFGDTKLVVADSFRLDHSLTDPILNNPAAAAHVGIVGGHIYGSGLVDYPLARALGKEVWMTEHYTDSSHSANDWPLALDVSKEIHDCMEANFSAYLWWYIRRSYGMITEDGNVSKRGFLMAHYSRFVLPGSTRIDATKPTNPNVFVTAYKSKSGVIAVAINLNQSAQTFAVNIRNGNVGSFAQYTTSATKNVADDGVVTLSANLGSVTLDAQSVTTLVSQ